jgi:hypothetical protein
MSHSVALPLTRVFSLPRIKFKKPHWPKGSRFWLICAVFGFLMLVRDIVGLTTNTKVWSLFGPVTVNWGDVIWQIFIVALDLWMFWRSRQDDDDGPSTE